MTMTMTMTHSEKSWRAYRHGSVSRVRLQRLLERTIDVLVDTTPVGVVRSSSVNLPHVHWKPAELVPGSALLEIVGSRRREVSESACSLGTRSATLENIISSPSSVSAFG